ncbi:outer membrane lipoprotein-sorting protein [Marispirochaeta sp.]|jgi:hypothetical protein|uniref:outer membrane lipoprotein-sorting protein n=1 Tax=Marispirochaeta sp. TaxID=2038653 RepID=UPI0029C81F70|nr:outer membrane lipoprotein-sorting protein [Marispirochaeta sp.]
MKHNVGKAQKLPGATLFCIAALLSIVSLPMYAQDAAAIMAEIDAKQNSGTSQSRMIMRIFPDRANPADFREMRVEGYGEGSEKSYMEFVAPAAIRGLRVLEIDNDTRVFFPSTGRVRRITGNQQGGSVGGVGGDFSYEDMGSGTYIRDYTFVLESQEATHYRIRGVPTDRNSSYTHLIFTVERSTMRVVQTDYFTAKDGHQKTLFQSEFRVIDGVEMPMRLEMVNLIKNQATMVEIVAVRYNITVDPKYFSPTRFFN